MRPSIESNANPRTVAIVQARYASSRLPGKVLMDLGGQPALAWVVERCRRAASVAAVVVATTDDPGDDAIAALCRERGWTFYRGAQFDVLDRYYQAALRCDAQQIVRVTGDCPFSDAGIIDRVVAEFRSSGADFAANRLPPPAHRTYPIGLDVEVCAFAGLERAWKEATEKFEREHVMPYFYDQPGRFKVRVVDHDPDYGYHRWTLDTPEDLKLLRAIVARMNGRMDFSWEDVLALFEREPELAQINAGVRAKPGNAIDSRME